jgi:Cu/Ag efflux protein CusF
VTGEEREVADVKNRTLVVLAMLAAAAPLAAWAQASAQAPKPMTRTQAVETTATIVAIDHTDRVITLKNEEGEVELGVGPEVKRFDELKVGDKITFRYQESLLVKIHKPGASAKTSASDEPAISRGAGPRPSGTISQQQHAVVTIKAIDPRVPAVTVSTEDGHTASYKVKDAKLLAGYKAGDKVEITYTEALMISVE